MQIMDRYAGTSDPTYVIRVSRANPEGRNSDGRLLRDVISALRTLGQGAAIDHGTGLWAGVIEEQVTVTVQATEPVLRDVLERLAGIDGLHWAHVEEHAPATAYVDLLDFKAGGANDRYLWDRYGVPVSSI